ncbi:shikimate dehydrogenase family protein, partial [Methanocalculus natronophilus]|uniref:shikimate dehydrogenase family protein n=1 Tax=Methanocalculus natronophilus TaxID=1262400 RepID=UPI003CCC7335
MYGLLGKTLRHSFSKQIHEALSPEMNYELLETKSLRDFIKTIPFKGLNVTLPYKHDVLDMLDYIDPTAKAIGAVNTIVLKDNKKHGYNTDYLALKEIIENTYPSNRNTVVTILGNGATKGTLMYALKQSGYQTIHVCAR